MKRNKQLDRLVKLAYAESLDQNSVKSAAVRRILKSFSLLPTPDALYCLKNYQKLLQKFINAHTLLIESPTKLSTTQIKVIQKTYHRYSTSQTKVEINPSLLAGLRLTIGDDLFEDSIISRIKQLGEIVHG